MSTVRALGALGVLGMSVPEEYGGAGLDAVGAAVVIE
jgi:alkylation response protein AidB-like acyl-CoA dehydrogenase